MENASTTEEIEAKDTVEITSTNKGFSKVTTTAVEKERSPRVVDKDVEKQGVERKEEMAEMVEKIEK